LNYDNSTYTGDRLRLDQAGNIKVKTDRPFTKMPLYLESYFKEPTENGKPNCSFIAPQRTLIDYEVCGTETISVKGGMKIPLKFNYTKYQDADAALNMTKLREMFTVNSTSCNFT
jgi:hypothetical protein